MKLESATTTETLEIVAPSAPAPVVPGLARAVFSFRVLLAVALAAITMLTVRNLFNNPDLWWHLRHGEIVWNTHTIPTRDEFSFTAYGALSPDHEWLAQWSMYAAYRLAGNAGLMLWLALLAPLLFVLVYLLCYRACGSPVVAFLGGICAWYFGTVGLAIRPLMLGHLFLVMELLCLERAATDRRWLWALPPLFAVWVNCHGSFLFGLAVMGVYCGCAAIRGEWGLVVSEPWDRAAYKRLFAVTGLCVGAVCCNPEGILVLYYPLNVLSNQTTSMNAIDEWLPPSLGTARGMGLVAVGVLLLLLPLLRRVELRLRELLTIGMAFGLALLHVRMLFLFGIVMAPTLCRLLCPVPEVRPVRERTALNAVLIFALLGTAVWAFPSRARIEEQIRQANPVGAVEFLRQARLPGPMLNDYGYGGYLIWALPEQKVFIDGRGDVFDPSGILAEYVRWATLNEDPKLLPDKYHIRLCLMPKDLPMERVLPYLPGWRLAYKDDQAAVYVR